MLPGDVVKLKDGEGGKTWRVEKLKSTSSGLWIVLQGSWSLNNDEVWHNSKHYEVVERK